MFVPRDLFDRLVGAYEAFMAGSRKDTEAALQMVLAAKDSEVRAVLAAKEREAEFMRQHIGDLKAALKEQTERAEAAIDRLLARDAEVPGVRMADLEREAAARTLDKPAAPDKASAVAKILSEANQVLEEHGQEDPGLRTTHIGGIAIGASDAEGP